MNLLSSWFFKPLRKRKITSNNQGSQEMGSKISVWLKRVKQLLVPVIRRFKYSWGFEKSRFYGISTVIERTHHTGVHIENFDCLITHLFLRDCVYSFLQLLHQFIHLSDHLTICLSIHQPTQLTFHSSIHLHERPTKHLTVCMPFHSPIRLHERPTKHLTVCMPFHSTIRPSLSHLSTNYFLYSFV